MIRFGLVIALAAVGQSRIAAAEIAGLTSQWDSTLVSYSTNCGCQSSCQHGSGSSCSCGVDCGPVADCCDCGGTGCSTCSEGKCRHPLGEPFVLWDRLRGGCCPPAVAVGGWFSFGYHSDVTPLSQTFGDGRSFNDVPNHLNLHQGWIYAEKEIDSSNGLDWGFRADLVYGTDAQKTQAFGNPPGSWDYQNGFDHGVYGWAIPQLYGEIGNEDWSVIMGHFFTLVGYEVVPAPNNFFYSHSLTMFNSEPFTHTGVLGTYSGFSDLTLYGGWTLGWDSGFDNNWSGSNFLGGFGLDLSETISVTYINTAGNTGFRGRDAYTHSVVVDIDLTENINYVFQSDYVDIGSTNQDQVGINQYLFYTWSDRVKFGGRAEWWKDNGTSHFEVTGGVNIRPCANFIVRPEARIDWTPSQTGLGGMMYADQDQTTFGIDGILTY